MFAVDEVIESHAAADCTGFISHLEWRWRDPISTICSNSPSGWLLFTAVIVD